jgi:hypothetical protein
MSESYFIRKIVKERSITLFLYVGNVKIGFIVMLLYYLQGILLRLKGVITTSFVKENIQLTVLSLERMLLLSEFSHGTMQGTWG